MKMFTGVAVLLLLTNSLDPTAAWTTITTSTPTRNTRTQPLHMASRNAKKLSSRSKWASSRGISSDGTPPTPDGFCTIVGGGRIGSLLSSNGPSLLLKRGDDIPSTPEGTPILIATRNDSLDGIIDACPDNRKADLVFLQNGYLDGYLGTKGLAENTQSLLFLSVPAMGVDAVDGITSVNPEGLTCATGVHAEALKERLGSLGLKCNVVTKEDYQPAMIEKLIWISTYMLVGTAKECASVGQAGSEHTELVQSIISELTAATSTKEGITFLSGTIERLAAYTDVVTDFPCAVKEFEWRNEYFYNLGDDACPVHNGLLRECKEKELIAFDLP